MKYVLICISFMVDFENIKIISEQDLVGSWKEIKIQ